MKCPKETEREETHKHDALAEMIDGGSAQDVPPLLDAPIVVVRGDSLKDEVFGAEGPQDARQSRRRRRLASVVVGGGREAIGDRERGEVSRLEGEPEIRDSVEDADLELL